MIWCYEGLDANDYNSSIKYSEPCISIVLHQSLENSYHVYGTIFGAHSNVMRLDVSKFGQLFVWSDC